MIMNQHSNEKWNHSMNNDSSTSINLGETLLSDFYNDLIICHINLRIVYIFIPHNLIVSLFVLLFNYEAPISWCKEEESTQKIITYLNESEKKKVGNNPIHNLKNAGQRILNNIQTHLDRDNKYNHESQLIGKHCVCSSDLYEDPKNTSSTWRRPRRGSEDSFFGEKPYSQRQREILSQAQEHQLGFFVQRRRSDPRHQRNNDPLLQKQTSMPNINEDDLSHKWHPFHTKSNKH